MKVVVVGGGLAGLAAAYRLQEQGATVRILESADRIGGRVRGAEQDGFVIDSGPTLVSDKYTEYLALVRDLGLSHLIVDSSPVIGVVKGRRLHLLDAGKPLRSFLTTDLLSAGQKLKLVLKGTKLLKPLRGLNPYDLRSHVHYDTESMQSYLDRVFGPELNDALLGAVARGVTLSTPREASVIEFFAGVLAAAGTMQNLVGGLDVLPKALAERLDVELNTAVLAVDRTEGGVIVVYRDASGVECTERADACIITTRFADAVELYPPLKEAGSDLLDATEYTGCYSLQVMYDRLTEQEPFIVLVPKSASEEVAAVFLEHVKAPDRAPAGKAQITVFFNPSDIDFSTWSDERLTTVAREFVESVFPELSGHFLGSHLTRWDYAAHQGKVGYYLALDTFLRDHPADDPIQVAGDYMSVAGQESAVVAGVTAAKRLLARRAALNPTGPESSRGCRAAARSRRTPRRR